jgi:hypothetical protein
MELLDGAMSPSTLVGIVEQWPCLKKMGIAIEGCDVKKIQPRKGGDLEVEYRLKLVNARTAGTFKETVLGRSYQDGMGEKDYTRLLAGFHERALVSADGRFPGFALYSSDSDLLGFVLYIPELRLLLHSALVDEALPGLQVALDPAAMNSLLGRYLPPSVSAEVSSHRCEVDTLHYKPGKRCILRYRLETGDGHTGPTRRSCVGKLYKDGEKGERAFAIMQELERRGFGQDAADGIKIPQPIAYFRDLQMLLMEDVPGSPLSDNLSSPQLADHLRAAARALAKIHRCPLTVDRDYQVEDELSSVERGVSRALPVCPELAGPLEKTLGCIAVKARQVTCPKPVLVHRDFQFDQVLLGNDAVTVIDFDSICNADPALDVGNFLARLQWKQVHLAWSEEAARSHAETFLTAYLPCIPAALMRRIEFYHRSCLLRLACQIALQPHRRHLVRSLLDERTSFGPFPV